MGINLIEEDEDDFSEYGVTPGVGDIHASTTDDGGLVFRVYDGKRWVELDTSDWTPDYVLDDNAPEDTPERAYERAMKSLG